MKNLVESIQILTRFATEIGNRAALIVEFDFPTGKIDLKDKNLTLLNSLFYLAIIDSVSYIHEYDQVFGIKTEIEFKNRIHDVKTINKPLISKIRQWKNLNDLRNQLLAHNLRQGKNGDFIFGLENLDYNAPRTLNDLFLLSNLIQFSTETINSEFKTELHNVRDSNLKDVKVTDKQLSKDDVSKITISLLHEADAEKIKLKREYSFSIGGVLDWEKL